MSCRLPGGVMDLPSLEALLVAGTETVGPVEARWNPAKWWTAAPTPGKSLTRHAHLLDDVAGFDAALFGISPREARAMDPRQRLLLEAAWAALEDAGIPPDGLESSRTGVYVGTGLGEWGRRTLGGPPEAIDGYAATGALSSVAAGRIAYALGLRGPALAVQTACSSSLVAIHLAMRALAAGEIDLAIAGGVNLLLDPEPFVAFSALGALSADGRCRPFDAAASGYGRGEGVGLLVLARAEPGRAALARLLGSAVNQDGRSNGLTAPNGAAQEAVIRAALADAGLSAVDVGALEAHGTGTPLGDPIEIAAAAAALGGGTPVQVHGTKAHLGHTEAAAGVVGVLAAIAMVRSGQVPAQPLVQQVNPQIAWGQRLRLASGAPLTGVVGVSAFGFSGTNAHVLVGPAPEVPAVAARSAALVVVSAATPRALEARVSALCERLARGAPLAAVARAAGRRAQQRERVAVVGATAGEVISALREASRATARRAPPVVFAFAGQGAQHPRMFEGVDDEPALAASFAEVDARVVARTGRSLRDVAADSTLLDRTEWAQIALFALEWALARTLLAWGIQPDAVLGHSIGALTAAAVAGACTLDEAVELVLVRGALMGGTVPGAMAAIGASEAVVAALGVPVAAVNGPETTVIAGPEAEVTAAMAAAEAHGLWARRLAVRHAFHSAAMDSILDAFEAAAARVHWQTPAIPFVSDATGRAETVLDAAYWRAHLRGVVRWSEARAAAAEVGDVVEIGPGTSARVALGRLWTAGWRFDAAAFDGTGRTDAGLPPYPFERVSAWIPRDDEISPVVARAVAWFPAALASPLGEVRDARGIRDASGVRALAAGLTGGWVRTVGAVSVAGEPVEPAQAAIWALLSCLALERPEAVAGLVDGDGALGPVGEPRLALRDGRGFVPRLVEAEPRPLPAPDPAALHVVTGAGGAVGGALLRWLAARGARRVLALGRSRPPVAVPGLDVVFRAVDLTDGAGVAAALADVPAGGWLVHAAGAGGRATGGDGWDEAFGAKVRGLDHVLAHLRPAAVLAPSSVAAVWGAPGLGAYAAANAWMAARLAALGVPFAAPAFGPWAAGGLVSAKELETFASSGIRPLEEREALAGIGAGAPVVAAVDTARLAAGSHARGQRSLFDPPPVEGLAARVGSALVRVLGFASGTPIPDDRGFFELGLDSVGAVALARALQDALGRDIPATAVFDHPTVARLAAWLEGAVPAAPVVHVASDAPIAVVGMACRFPGAPSPEALWELLNEGRDPVGRSPADRWAGAPEVGGFLDDLAQFDPEPFGMTPREAAAVDPQHRLVLTVAWEALERAGFAPTRLRDASVGVFVGIGRSEYGARIRPGDDAWPWSGTGNETSFAAGRLAYVLGSRGPALAVSTACSSSLVALDLAVASLRRGACDLAVVAGTNALLDPEGFRWLRDIGALSASGRCRTFSEEADGYARSEGCGVLVLARVDRVTTHDLPVLAWVRGTAVGHDGRTAGPTVPSGPAQEAVIRAALAAAGAAPADVGYLEAHGTGTPLGDPIEIGALASVFSGVETPVVVGALKSHLGHLEAAAGVAAVIGAILALQHGQVPGIRHLRRPNPRLPLGTWGQLAQGPTPLDPGRLAGVSAFGFSGTNAHVVLAPAAVAARAAAPTTRFRPVRCWVDAVATPAAWEVAWVTAPAPASTWRVETAAALLAGWADRAPPRVVEVADGLAGAAVHGAAASLAIEAPDAEIQVVRRRAGAWEKPVFRRAEGATWAPIVGPGEAVVITGATGGVGRALVDWCRARGAGRIIAVARTPAPLGDDVVFVAGDVAEPETWARVPRDVPIAGVIHAAGVTAAALAAQVDAERLAAVGRPKVGGLAAAAAWLDAVAPDAWLVAFGSATAWLGAVGQVAYGAANAAMAAQIDARAATGRRAACLAWGPWTVGLAAGHAWVDRGATPMAPALALRALDRVRSGTTLILDPGWAPEPAGPRAATRRVRDATDVLATVRRLALEVSHLSALDDTRGWFDAGFDSLMAVELARRLTAVLGEPVGPTSLFAHPTPDALARHLAGGASGVAAPATRVAADDPIAIVGLACRFPGADSPEALWRLLCAGAVPLRDVPPDRWDAGAWAARIASPQGGFLDGIDQFDPELYGISGREAASLDPQQRLLLDTAWRATEHLGDALPRNTGVYVGISDRGYLRRFSSEAGHYPDNWAGTGNDPAFGPGRLAYHLGLEGPAVAVNTTCSASLVAVHLAAEALRRGECDAALAGGVSLLLNPDDSAYLTSLGALSPTGRCWSFDAAADGYIRAEGCGVVVLERLSDARARGHRVWAVLRGSAVNHDGASGGLTVPSGPAQQRVLRAALAAAGVEPQSVGLIEAHGTGTRLGDPIEVEALRAVYHPRTAPLHLGTIKANLGHLELAAGVAGLLRAVLALAYAEIPPHPTFSRANPELSLDGFEVATVRTPWTGPRRAAVSAFGLSGTNVHVILDAADGPPAPVADASPALWPLSGHRAEAVVALAAAVAGRPAGEVADALQRRPALRFRAATWSDGPVGAPREAPSGAPRIGWLFTGQGSTWAGMGADLDALPVVRRELDRADAVLRPELGVPLREVFADPERLASTAFAQPALVALQWALAAQWEAAAGPPRIALGHSVGGLGAALVAGVFPFEEGLRLVALRGRLMAALPVGAMAAVGLPVEAVRALLAPGVEIAAVNADDEAVVSGTPEAVAALGRRLAGARFTPLGVSRAFHSASLEPMLDAWEAALGAVPLSAPRFPLISETTGAIDGPQTAAAWRLHARAPVAFARAAAAFAAATDLGVELGPHPVLAGLLARTDREVLPTLRRGSDGERAVWSALGAAWERGVRVDWHALRPRAALPGVPVHLPLQPRRFWLSGDAATRDERVYALGFAPAPPGERYPDAELWRAPLGSAEDGCIALHAALRAGRRLVVVTRNGAPLGATDPEQAAVWAFARCAQVEAPDRLAAVVDTDADAELVGWAGGADVVLRGGVAYAPRLERAPLAGATPRLSGTWLVTGGHGALGGALAAWLVGCGASSLVLVSRRGGGAPDLGVPVRSVAADVSEAGVLAGLLAGVDGVVHAAGVTDPAPLDALDPARIRAVLAPKVARALLDFAGPVIALSSVSVALGSKDLAPYAAANAFLEAVVRARRAAGRPGWSLALGPVAGGGMVDATRQAALARLGQRPLPLADVLRLLGGAIAADVAAPIVADLDWPRFLQTYEAFGPRAVTAAFRRSPETEPPVAVAPTLDVAALVGKTLARPGTLPRDVPLTELGLDSLLATELHAALRAAGATVSLGRLLGGPSIAELEALLASAPAAEASAAVEADVPPVLIWSHLGAALLGAGVALAAWLLVSRLLAG